MRSEYGSNTSTTCNRSVQRRPERGAEKVRGTGRECRAGKCIFRPLHKHGSHSGGGCRRARAGQSRVMMSRDYRDVSSATTAPRSALAVSPISEIAAGCDDVIKRRAARQCGATDTLTSSIYALYHFLYHCQQQQQQNQSHHLHTEPNHFRLSLN